MKILLTPPIWSHKDQSAEFRSVTASSFNFGFACLSGYLKARGHDVTIVDPQIVSRREYDSTVREGSFDLIGITAWTTAILRAYETARLLKAISPSSHLVLGGVHPTLMPERTLSECEYADSVIVGEGEKPLLALANALERGENAFTDVPSLTYRHDGRVVSTPRCEPLKSEDLPFPDYSGAGIRLYRANLPHFKSHPTYQLSLSRGCPLKCAFCNASQALGAKPRFKPVRAAIEELALLREEFGARGFSFCDSTFTINRRWIYEFCEEYGRTIKLPWACFTRVDCISEDLIRLMRDSGCWQIGFGFESANQKTLDSIQKGTTVEQNRQAIRLCRKYGIRIYGSFILGWPGETHEDALRTVRWAIRHAIPCCLYNIPLPFPHTRLYDLALADGGLSSDLDWRAYDSNVQDARLPVYVNPLIGPERMVRLRRIALMKHYSSPKILFGLLRSLSTKDQCAALMPMGLAFLRIMGSTLRSLSLGVRNRSCPIGSSLDPVRI